MGKLDDLAKEYEDHLRIPWGKTLAGAQRVIVLVYDKELERSLRVQVDEFRQSTQRAGFQWEEVDMTASFAKWMAGDEYRDTWFECPEDLEPKISDEFLLAAAGPLKDALRKADDKTIVAMTGVASLYGFARLSLLIREVEPDIKGRLVVFFPGSREAMNLRLLDARDGWNYLATCLPSHTV